MPRYDEFSALGELPPQRMGGFTSVAAYGDWLGRRAPWQLFASFEVKDMPGYVIGVAGAERFLRSWFQNSIRTRTRSESGNVTAYAAFALEQHRDRVPPHFHGLIGGLPSWMVNDVALGLVQRNRRLAYMFNEWYRDHGRCRIEPIRGVVGDLHPALGAARYASKYMLKDMGKFYAFGKWPPVSEYDESNAVGDDVYDRWEQGPGYANAERVWREMCEGESVRF